MPSAEGSIQRVLLVLSISGADASSEERRAGRGVAEQVDDLQGLLVYLGADEGALGEQRSLQEIGAGLAARRGVSRGCLCRRPERGPGARAIAPPPCRRGGSWRRSGRSRRTRHHRCAPCRATRRSSALRVQCPAPKSPMPIRKPALRSVRSARAAMSRRPARPACRRSEPDRVRTPAGARRSASIPLVGSAGSIGSGGSRSRMRSSPAMPMLRWLRNCRIWPSRCTSRLVRDRLPLKHSASANGLALEIRRAAARDGDPFEQSPRRA